MLTTADAAALRKFSESISDKRTFVRALAVCLLADHLAQQFEVHLSNSTLRRRMKAMGLRYKLPRYVYEEKEPNRAQKKGRSFVSSASGPRERQC